MPAGTAYCCARCGYKTDSKTQMRKHFDRQKICPGLLDASFELTDEAKQFILDNRIFSTPKISEHQKITAKEQILCLKLEVAMLRGKHDMWFRTGYFKVGGGLGACAGFPLVLPLAESAGIMHEVF